MIWLHSITKKGELEGFRFVLKDELAFSQQEKAVLSHMTLLCQLQNDSPVSLCPRIS